MNETLTVRDFGPIREAEVTFKRVTVFIGPTGGGKSTLAKLAAVFRDGSTLSSSEDRSLQAIKEIGLGSFHDHTSNVQWINSTGKLGWNNDESLNGPNSIQKAVERSLNNEASLKLLADEFKQTILAAGASKDLAEAFLKTADIKSFAAKRVEEWLHKRLFPKAVVYIPAERVFYGSVSFSLAGLMRDDINLPKPLLEFVNTFAGAKKEITDLELPLFGVKYEQRGGDDYIRIPGREKPLYLYEAASGIQSVAPLLVLLEHLSRQTERPQSFIIEEPELNLYPEAQQALLNVLIEKCAKAEGKNDLIITTHSPYVLTVLNTLMYAHKVAHEVPDNAKKVEKLVPRKYWIDPAQFAAYYVDLPSTKKKQQVRSIVDKKTGMIGENELDQISFTLADLLGKLLDLRTPPKPKATEKARA